MRLLHQTNPRAGRSGRACAFTLVEILIALGILSLVLAAIFSSWTSILRASKVGQDAAAAVQRARMAARTIEESLGAVESFANNQQLYGFEAVNGSDAYLSFVARLSKFFPRSGKFGDFDVRRVTFSLESGNDNSRQLVLRQQPILMEMDKDELEHPLVLARNVKEFVSEFWDARMNDWVDQWLNTNQLPSLVRVTVQLQQNAAHSTVAGETVTRIVSLPAIAVQAGWQTPMIQGNPGAQPGAGGQPGSQAGGTGARGQP